MIKETEISTINDIVEKILGKLPTKDYIPIELPSKNLFYGGVNNVEIRSMEYEDELAMLKARKNNIDPINLLLTRCTKGIEIENVIILDKLFLLLKIRALSYGNEYSTKITCPKCEYDSIATFNLDLLPIEPFPDNYTDPIEVTLPVIKKPALVRLPRVSDEKYLSDPEIANSQLWRFVVKIAGNDNKEIISKVIDGLKLKDRHTILNTMNPKFGIRTQVKATCQSCRNINILELPITADFFTIS